MVCCLNPECEKPINVDGSGVCQSCGTELVETLFNRFRVKEPMGQGGFGRTYLGEDLHTFGEECAVKQLTYAAQGSQANQKIVELFMREAQQLLKLRKNTQIPDLLAYFEENGYLYLVQELIAGEDLQKELLREGPFNETKIRELLTGILPVLEFIHERGLVHRDLKPPNIMRRRDTGELILIDFGVSKQLSRKLTTVYGITSVGTQGYAPYEQMSEEGAKPEPASDLYSLGATCFHLMTGIFPGDLWARQGYGWCDHWTKHLKQPISNELQIVLSKLLQFEVRDRYQSATEVLATLSSSLPPTELAKPETSVPLPQTEVVDQAEIKRAYQLRCEEEQEAYENNLRQYEKEFSRIIERAYPLDQYALDGFKQFQQQLGLLDEDVQRIEAMIRARAIQSCQEQAAEERRQTGQSQGQPSPYPRPTDFWAFETVRLNAQGEIVERRQCKANYFQEQGLNLDMVWIPGGSFTMGSPSGELERFETEGPQHKVNVPDFFLGRYAVTQAQWKAVMGNNPSTYEGTNRPVEDVNWNDAIAFCEKLSNLTGRAYRLPSEAEWEYACRAGTTTPFYFGETLSPSVANYDSNEIYGSGPMGTYREQTTEVGIFPPNHFGLYDMHGNVWEWCQDSWHDNYDGAPTDGSAWEPWSSKIHVVRGGNYFFAPEHCRSAKRMRLESDEWGLDFLGFRLALSASGNS